MMRWQLGQRVVNRAREELFTRYALPPTRRERIAKRFIARFLPAAPVIVECGAHTGDDTVEMAHLWPAGSIYAFEPVPPLFAQLERRVAGFSNVHCYRHAISSDSGVQRMFISGGSSDASSSLLVPADHLESHPDLTFNHDINVSTTTFGEWARQAAVSVVDLFWLDMQGAEFPSMLASPDLICGARAIHTEVSMRETYKGVAQYAEVKAWMESRGFRVAAEAIPTGWDMGNVLFVRPNPGT
jgi:FkbM family methyltransferase